MVPSLALLILLIIAVCVIVNLVNKQEKAEDIITSQAAYMTKLSESIAYCSIKINAIDEKEVFASDDEIGWWFKEVQEMQSILNQYNEQ